MTATNMKAVTATLRPDRSPRLMKESMVHLTIHGCATTVAE